MHRSNEMASSRRHWLLIVRRTMVQVVIVVHVNTVPEHVFEGIPAAEKFAEHFGWVAKCEVKVRRLVERIVTAVLLCFITSTGWMSLFQESSQGCTTAAVVNWSFLFIAQNSICYK